MLSLFCFRKITRRCAFLTLLLTATLAHAGLLMQEGFNYPVGILGSNAPWSSPTSLISSTNAVLTYSNLSSLGTGSAVVAAGSTAASYRTFDSTVSNGFAYCSFLINFSSKPGSYYIAGLLQNTNVPLGGSAADPVDLIDNTYLTGYKLGIRAKGGTTVYITNSYSPLLVGNTYFLVMKYSFATGVSSLFLNPVPGATEPTTADAVCSNPSGVVPDLSYFYLRSGSSTAGTFSLSTLRAGTTWSDVVPQSQSQGLIFSTQPSNTVAGVTMSSFRVQLQSSPGVNLASNGVPVSISLSGGGFSAGTTNLSTGTNGAAIFNNLVITNAGPYAITATATGFGSASSTAFNILPAAINHYVITAPSSATLGNSFSVTGTAYDVYGNAETQDNSTMVTLGSNSGNVTYDANNNGIFGEANDNVATLSGGAFSVNAMDNNVETAIVTTSDSNGKLGSSGYITVSTNPVTAQGLMLNTFLSSLQVDRYWLNGVSVNWMTGSSAGSGPNSTAGTASHCSAFAGAVTFLLNIYILRQPDASDIDLANHQADWLPTNTFGWFPIATGLQAQHLADGGTLVVGSYKSSSGSGHIAILRASTRSDSDINLYGPEECQSGTYNFADTNVVTGFSEHPGAFPSGIKYYGHAVNYPISPVGSVFQSLTKTNQTLAGTVSTIVGRKYQVQWSSNLVTWNTLVSRTNSNASSSFWTNVNFTDSVSNVTRRFYRVSAN